MSVNVFDFKSDNKVDVLRFLYKEIKRLRDLRPSPKVNYLFGTLVKTLVGMTEEESDSLLKLEMFPKWCYDFNEICAAAEFEMEVSLVKDIIQSNDPEATLQKFSYIGNYVNLVKLEVDLFKPFLLPNALCLFVGSGPIMLSSLLMQRQYGLKVDNLEKDDLAYNLSLALLKKLDTQMKVIHTNFFEFSDLDKYDLVIIAALVGSHLEEKRKAIEHVRTKMKPGALLMVRSAYKQKKILYPEVTEDLFKGFKILKVMHPSNDVINSCILARK